MLLCALVGIPDGGQEYHLRSNRLIMMVRMTDKSNPVVMGSMNVKLPFLKTISPGSRNRATFGKTVRKMPVSKRTKPSTIMNLAR